MILVFPVLKEAADGGAIAAAGGRVQVDQDVNPQFRARGKQSVHPIELRVQPCVVRRNITVIRRAAREASPGELPAHVVGLPLACQDFKVGRRDIRGDHRAP